MATPKKITIRIRPDQVEKLDAMVQPLMSRNHLIRAALDEFIAKQEAK